MLLGLLLLGKSSDPLMKHLANKHNDGKLKPEYRLPILIYAGPTIPLGLFIYGWTAQYQVSFPPYHFSSRKARQLLMRDPAQIQWAVPLLGTLFVGVGLIACFMCINTYLVDTYVSCPPKPTSSTQS